MRTYYVVLLGLVVFSLTSVASAKQLTGASIKELLSNIVIRAGTNDKGSPAVIVSRPDGRAILYWGLPSDPPTTVHGMWRIDGDKLCQTWKAWTQKEACAHVRKVGDRYEAWRKDGFGDDKKFFTFHILSRH
jgi:hypothetical protein